jgi:hypothetical protein
MSLHDILLLRKSRQKPSGVVSVVIGKIPQIHRSEPFTVEVAPGSNPALMDWRPLVGVWVSIIHVDGDWHLMDQTVEALTKAGAKLIGFVMAGRAHLLANFDDLKDEYRAKELLVNEWEAMCS